MAKDDGICWDTLATHVYEEFLENTFVPLMVPCAGEGIDPSKAVEEDNGEKGLLAAINTAVEAELVSQVPVPTAEEIFRPVKLKISRQSSEAARLQCAANDIMWEQANQIHQERLEKAQQDALRELPFDAIANAPNPVEALRRLAKRLGRDKGVFGPGVDTPPVVNGTPPRRSDELCPLQDLGLLFLERLRDRPTGYTFERAPFYELSLLPGEAITVEQKSFSQRTVTLEEFLEETKEQRLEFESSLSTEMSSEYVSETEKRTNWKIEASGDIPITKNLKVKLAGDYGASTLDKTTMTETSKRTRETTRKVASKQTETHRTTVKIVNQESFTSTTTKTFSNTTEFTKKVFMRKLMRVHHMSYERYGVRMVWSPCVKDPGKDVRDLLPGSGGFAREIAAIREKWKNTAPPPEVGSPPGNQEDCGPFIAKQAPLGGKSWNISTIITIPSGYVFSSAGLDIEYQQGGHVEIHTMPVKGSTGVATIVVHVSLGWSGVKAEKVKYKVLHRMYAGSGDNGPLLDCGHAMAVGAG